METAPSTRRRGRPASSHTSFERRLGKAAYNKERYRQIKTGEWPGSTPRCTPPAAPRILFNAAALRRAASQHLPDKPWWGHHTPAERLAALEAKMDREVAVALPRKPNGTPLPILLIAA